MKISFYELFDLMAEEALELLSEDTSDSDASSSEEVISDRSLLDSSSKDTADRESRLFSSETTINGVLEMIGQEESLHVHVFKKKKIKLKLLLVALIGAGLSAAAVALADQPIILNGFFQRAGAEEINDANRVYVGKELKAGQAEVRKESEIREKAAAGVSSKKESEITYQMPDFIKSIESDDPFNFPYAMDTFESKKEDGYYTIPEVIFTNNSMVIFTKEGAKGWKLKKGQTPHFEAEEYPSQAIGGRGQAIIYTYTLDGKLMNKDYSGHGRYGLSQKYALKAEKSGEYYLCLIGASSDSISIKSGRLYVE